MASRGRDVRGYGRNPPPAQWPGRARIAVDVNRDVEAGGERSVGEGDGTAESMPTDTRLSSNAGRRSPLVETAFEYGTRVGNRRLLRLLEQFDVEASVPGVMRSLRLNPEAVQAFREDGHEIVSHGCRWLDDHLVDEATERGHIRLAMDGIEALTGREHATASTTAGSATPGTLPAP